MKVFYTEEMKSLESRLKSDFEQQKRDIIGEFESILKEVTDSFNKEERKNRDLEEQLRRLKVAKEEF